MKSLFILVAACTLGVAPVPAAQHTTVVAWNNLGMHCMDDDYSVFSILPPFNTLDAQVLDLNGKLVRAGAGYVVDFEAVPDAAGSLNTTSAGKTNFWAHSPALFGATLPVDAGLAGVPMPGALGVRVPLSFSTAMNWFEAAGIPIAPWDDAGRYNPYPTVRVNVRSASTGAQLATTTVVLPVSEEMDCKACHGSSSGPAARPAAGWVNDPMPKRDFRLNILRLHDERHLGDPAYTAALAERNLNPDGLEASVVRDTHPVLCASCHASEALAAGGAAGVKPLTTAIHGKHAAVLIPSTGLPMSSSASRDSCYQCHPGSATRCLRGAMGGAVDASGALAIQCQDCHGGMSDVGSPSRTGWLDEPNCQACHTGTATQNSGQIRYTRALTATGALRVPANTTFATSANTPLAGKSLYRFSTGHGGLQCSACHGSTHAEYPGTHSNDNLGIAQTQGHIGVLSDCTACHPSMPTTTSGGPHGMHPVGSAWISDHHDANRSGCSSCHGADYRGTVLSRALGDRSFATRYGTKTFFRGQKIGCYDCHNGLDTSGATAQMAPTVPATLSLGSTPRGRSVSATLAVTPVAGTTLRVVRQPAHGRVAVNGLQLTYIPDAGFVGDDSFTYAAGTASRESNLGNARVSVLLGDPAAQPAGDGVDALLRYALGTDPALPLTPAQLPETRIEVVAGTPRVTLTIHRNPLATGIADQVEVSSDLVNWTAVTDPAAILNNQPGLLKVCDPAPSTTGGRFIRYKVVQQ